MKHSVTFKRLIMNLTPGFNIIASKISNYNLHIIFGYIFIVMK